MKINIEITYDSTFLDTAGIVIFVNGEEAYWGGFLSFDKMIQSLVPTLIENGKKRATYILFNEEEEIFLQIKPDTITLIRTDSKSIIELTKPLYPNWFLFQKVPEDWISKTIIYYDMKLPYPIAVALFIRMIDVYLEDWQKYCEKKYEDDVRQMKEFIDSYKSQRADLELLSNGISEKIEIVIQTRINLPFAKEGEDEYQNLTVKHLTI